MGYTNEELDASCPFDGDKLFQICERLELSGSPKSSTR